MPAGTARWGAREGLATTRLYVSEDTAVVDHLLNDVLGPLLQRDP